MVIVYCRPNSDEKTFIGDRHRQEKVMRKSLENEDDADASIPEFWLYSVDFDIGDDDLALFFVDENKTVHSVIDGHVVKRFIEREYGVVGLNILSNRETTYQSGFFLFMWICVAPEAKVEDDLEIIDLTEENPKAERGEQEVQTNTQELEIIEEESKNKCEDQQIEKSSRKLKVAHGGESFIFYPD